MKIYVFFDHIDCCSCSDLHIFADKEKAERYGDIVGDKPEECETYDDEFIELLVSEINERDKKIHELREANEALHRDLLEQAQLKLRFAREIRELTGDQDRPRTIAEDFARY